MKLSNKHSNVQTVTFSDFTGGLNTTYAPEAIAENELANAVNVEIYNGQLRTVAGLSTVYKDSSKTFDYLLYDSIGKHLLLVDTNHSVYIFNDDTIDTDNVLSDVGELTGTSSVQYAPWEDGIIIASGGQLQYFHDGILETLYNSPDECHGVFIREGRVWTYYDDIVKCSAVGDETNWTNNTNDESSAQWAQIGYKDGGEIVGLTSLSSDVLIFKNNRHAYHLSGSYPNWNVQEVGRQIDCKNYNCCVALRNDTLVLGKTKMQMVSTTDAYGDMTANEVSAKVVSNITRLSADTRLRYIPSLNQVWLLQKTSIFLFFDANIAGWFKRMFAGHVADALEANGKIYLLKENGLFVLDSTSIYDDGYPMQWLVKLKNLIAHNNYLIKRVWVDATPSYTHYAESLFVIGRTKIGLAQPTSARYVYHNFERVYKSNTRVRQKISRPIATNSEDVYGNPSYVFGNEDYVFQPKTYRSEVRCVDREKNIRISGRGTGGLAVFNAISFDIAEV